jgi:hypothetical protein
MKNLQLELAEATLTDIKELVKKYPNDMDLGKHVRSYFLNLPELLEKLSEEISSNKNKYDEGLK